MRFIGFWWGRLIAVVELSDFARRRTRMPGAGSSSRSTSVAARWGFAGRAFNCGRRTSLKQRCIPSDGMARPTSRQGRSGALGANAISKLSCGYPRHSVEEGPGFEHCVHYDRQLARDCDCSSLEAKPLFEREPPSPQAAVG